MQKRGVCTMLLAVGLLQGLPVLATTYTWNSTTAGNWADTTKWTPSGIPNVAGDVAIITNGLPVNTTITVNITTARVGTITFGNSSTSLSNDWTVAISGSQTLTLDNGAGGALIAVTNRNATFTAAGTFAWPATVTATVAAASSLTLPVLSLPAAGNLTTLNGPGVLALTGDNHGKVWELDAYNNGSLWVPNKVNLPTNLVLNGGALRWPSSMPFTGNNIQTLKIGSPGGIVEIVNYVIDNNNYNEYTGVAGGQQSFLVGAPSAPVAFDKWGGGKFWLNYANGSTLTALAFTSHVAHVNSGVYGGMLKYPADAAGTRTTRVYAAEIVGGHLKLGDDTQYVGGNGSIRLRSTANSLGVLSVRTNMFPNIANLLTADSAGGVLSIDTGVAVPNMSNVGDGLMWLTSPGVYLTSTTGYAGRDGNYRLTPTYDGGSFFINAINAITGSVSSTLYVGQNKINGGGGYVALQKSNSFVGAVQVVGNNICLFGNANSTTLRLYPAFALGGNGVAAPTFFVGPNAGLSLYATGAITNSPITLNAGTIDGGANAGIFNYFGALTAKGPSSVSFATPGASKPVLSFSTIASATGGVLAVLGGVLGSTAQVLVRDTTTTTNFYRPYMFVGATYATNFSAYDAVNGVVAASYTAVNPAPGTWDRTVIADFTSSPAAMTADATIGAIHNSAATTIDTGANNLTVDKGAILAGAGALIIGTNNTAGTLTAGAGAQSVDGIPTIFLYNPVATSLLTVNAKVTGSISLSLCSCYYASVGIELKNANNDFVGNVYLSAVKSGQSGWGPVNVWGDQQAFGNANNAIFCNAAELEPKAAWICPATRAITLLEGGLCIGGSATYLCTINGKLTGPGPLQMGSYYPAGGFAAPQIVKLTNPANDFSGSVHVYGSLTYGSLASLRAGAANVLGNNAALSLYGATTVLDLTDNGNAPNGYSQNLGALEGTGNVLLGATNALTIGGRNSDMAYGGTISGGGNLTKTGSGWIFLGGPNAYMGTTTISGGRMKVLWSGSLASTNIAVTAGGTLEIATNAASALTSGTTLSIAAGGTNVLAAGINTTVRTLTLGGVRKQAGTYGSTLSAAQNRNDVYFSGPGMLTVTVSPPSAGTSVFFR